MDKLKYKRISRETELTEKQIQILNFIARWKFVTSAMLGERFNFSLPYATNVLLKLIQQNLVKRVKSSVCKAGAHEFIYFITKKALKYLNPHFTYLSNPKKAYHLAEHAMTCLKIIKQLNLSESQYLTEMELSIRYRETKQELSLESKPRICDFAYKDPLTNELVGVEVELHIKDKKTYCAPEFDPANEKPSDIKFQNKDRLKFGVYVGGGVFDYVKTRNINLDLVRQDAQKQGYDPNKVWLIKKYLITYTDQEGDEGVATVEGFSINQAKTAFYSNYTYSGYKVKDVALFKERDCIIHRHYYALNKKFYNRIDWYLPEGIQYRFIKNMKEIFKNNIPNFYQIHTFKPDFIQTLNYNLLNYVKKE